MLQGCFPAGIALFGQISEAVQRFLVNCCKQVEWRVDEAIDFKEVKVLINEFRIASSIIIYQKTFSTIGFAKVSDAIFIGFGIGFVNTETRTFWVDIDSLMSTRRSGGLRGAFQINRKWQTTHAA